MISQFIVALGERSKRLDAFLVSRERKVSRTGLQKLILAGRIRVNEELVKPSQKIKPGDRITIDEPVPGPLLVENSPVALEILFEDEVILVVNKPAGVVVHPTSGNWNGTLLNGLLEHLQSHEKGEESGHTQNSPGLVHRLDKETSGIMVISKTNEAHRALCSQFEKATITKTYEALLSGRPRDDQGTIHLAIGRDVIEGKKVSINTMKPQDATTEFTVLENFGDVASRVELLPHTGRQHQLRVHVSSLGCAILGDPLYGREKDYRLQGLAIRRMMLHATKLRIRHPMSDKWEEFNSPLPTEMKLVMESLNAQPEEKGF